MMIQDVIEYTGVDGVKRKMPREEMIKKLEQQQADFPAMGEDGLITKTQEGKTTLEEVRR